MTRRWGSVVRRQGPSYPGCSGAGLGEEAGPTLSGGRDLRPGGGAYPFQGRVPSYIFSTGQAGA